MDLISIFFLIVGLAGVRFSKIGKFGLVTVVCLFLCFLLFTVFLLVADQLTGHGFDESVFFHLAYGIGGAGIWDFLQIILTFLGSILACLLLAFFLYKYLDRTCTKWKYARRLGPIPIVLLSASLYMHPLVEDLRVVFSVPRSQEFTKFYHAPTLKGTPDRPPNIVYIYLESLERTYMDEGVFPGLVKELKKIERSALSFTNISQSWGMGWTIAGITASQCGIPLVTNGSNGNAMNGMSEFLPNAICLGDILQKKGFNLSYMGGASLDFAGKGKFFTTHGFERVRGLSELKGSLTDPAYVNNWGLYDDTLFDQALEEFQFLSGREEPFGLFLLTMDTHHPNGHPSASCKSVRYQEGKKTMLDSVACSDYLVGKFVRKIMNSDYAENTLIVLSSDHLALPNQATDMLEQGERKNLFMVIWKGQIRTGKNSKPGTLLDVAPTLLSLLGYENLSFGLGRNLLSDSPTMREEHGNLKQLLKSFNADLSKFWRIPILKKDIRIDAQNEFVEIDEEKIKIPVLLSLGKTQKRLLSQQREIKKIIFPSPDTTVRRSLHKRLANFKEDEFFVWIDKCRATRHLIPADVDLNNYCLVVGELGSKDLFHAEIFEEEKFPYLKLKNF